MLFGYVVVLVPNLVFSFGGGVFVFILLLIVSCGVLIMWGDVVSCGGGEGVTEVGKFLYGDYGFCVLVGLGGVLLLALVCVVKVCYFQDGSLRPFEAV